MVKKALKQDGAPTELEAARGRLAELIARWAGDRDDPQTPIPALKLFRIDRPTEPVSYMHVLSVCLIVQGAKRVLLGTDVYEYDAHHYLVTSIDVPVVAQVIEATPQRPYLGMTIGLDRRMIAQLMVDQGFPLERAARTGRGMAVSEVNLPLLNAILRLVTLLDTPEDIPILAPLAEREIIYRLLTGEQGARLRQVGVAGSHGHQIARAIDWLKGNFSRALRVEDLATEVGMSTSTFHHHFREITAMSPLQFQKWLRLSEARRLMLVDRLDAASAAFEVGYESPSQFSREYSRQFGAPPKRDIQQLQQSTV